MTTRYIYNNAAYTFSSAKMVPEHIARDGTLVTKNQLEEFSDNLQKDGISRLEKRSQEKRDQVADELLKQIENGLSLTDVLAQMIRDGIIKI